MKKIDKYQSDYSTSLSFRCILDHRFKFGFLRFCYSKLGLDSMAVEAKLKIVKHKLYILYNEYVKLYSKKQTTCNVASSQCSSQGTSSVSTFASGKSSTSQWLIVNVSSCFCLLFQSFYFVYFTLFFHLYLRFFLNNIGVYTI